MKKITQNNLDSLKIRLKLNSLELPNGCIVWTKSKNKKGYGAITSKVNGKKRDLLAHRASWIVHNNKYPEKLILHSCDNPPCINIDHLREGTAAENSAEMVRKNRTSKFWFSPDDFPTAKLTCRKVKHIKRLINERKMSLKQIGEKFNVSMFAISDIKRNKTWRGVGQFMKKDSEFPVGTKLNIHLVREIRQKLSEGKSCSELAPLYGIHSQTGRDIRNRKLWKRW